MTGTKNSYNVLATTFYLKDGAIHRVKDDSVVPKFSPPSKNGYYVINTPWGTMKHSRAIWILHNKKDIPPGGVIDHVNRDRADDDPSNLRLSDIRRNTLNSARVDSAKGYTYVKWKNKYQAFGSEHGTTVFLGEYDSADEAQRAHLEHKQNYDS